MDDEIPYSPADPNDAAAARWFGQVVFPHPYSLRVKTWEPELVQVRPKSGSPYSKGWVLAGPCGVGTLGESEAPDVADVLLNPQFPHTPLGGIIFARFLTYTGLVGDISDWMLALELSPFMYLVGFAVLYLLLGMLIDPIAIMVMTLPVMFPILTSVGYDPIWLGVIAIKLAEISLITPPVGLNVYVVRSASPVPLRLEEVFAGVTPFLMMDFVTLGLLIAFPSIVLFLPNLMS